MDRVEKIDPNSEIFQMRAQWKKQEITKNLWNQKWSWLLEERKLEQDQMQSIKKKFKTGKPVIKDPAADVKMSLKPVPVTSTGFIGWIASKPECKLEKYTSWIVRIPLKLPDAWDDKNYKNK